MDCSPPDSVHGIFQARIVEWVAIPFSKGSSQLWDQTRSLALQADSMLYYFKKGKNGAEHTQKDLYGVWRRYHDLSIRSGL